MAPTTRSATVPLPPRPWSKCPRGPPLDLFALPDEVFLIAARTLLEASLPSALRLRCVCTALRGKLELVKTEALARRFQWLPELTCDCDITNNGRTITADYDDHILADWAAGRVMPTVGVTKWSVRVDRSYKNKGGLRVGVCDAANRSAWGLHLCSGLLGRATRDANGMDTFLDDAPRGGADFSYLPEPPPDGYPDFHGTPVGPRFNGRANGLKVNFELDHDAGQLLIQSVAVSTAPNGVEYISYVGPAWNPFKGFPKGAALRPWARLAYDGDQVSFTTPYIVHSGARAGMVTCCSAD